MVNYFIVYELDSWPWDLDTDFNLGGCLFGDIKLTENANPDKYSYSDYGIGFVTHSEFSLPDGSWYLMVRKNVIVLELIRAHLCILIIKEKIS